MSYRACTATLVRFLAIWLGLTSFGDTWCAEPVNAARLDQAIERAAGYLVRAVLEDGRFVYRINPDAVSVAPSYNILRHAGAMYALAAYHRQRPNEPSQRALLRAGEFLHSQMGSVPGHAELMAVWSRPTVNGSGGIVKGKLGGAGLGLIALSELENIQPRFTPPEALDRLAQFILFLQKEDGSYYSLYLPSREGRDDDWTSLYYPGEAALGLLMLHRHQPKPAWSQAAADTISYLARTRAGNLEVPPDHWALIATAELMQLVDRGQVTADRQLLISHAAQVSRHMIAAQGPQHDHAELDGCFDRDGRTTPTATRLEGLLATLAFLRREAPYAQLVDEMEEACHRGIGFLLRAQVEGGPTDGGFPRAMHKLPPAHPSYSKSFNERAAEVRIDYVQHALCACLQYREHFLGQSD